MVGYFVSKQGTEFEFVKVVKANFHYSAGFMFLITFQVLDPSDNQEKLFQAKVRYSTRFPAEYVFCRPRPDPEGSFFFSDSLKFIYTVSTYFFDTCGDHNKSLSDSLWSAFASFFLLFKDV